MATDRLKIAAEMLADWEALERRLKALPPAAVDLAKVASEEEQRELDEAFATDSLPEYVERHPRS